MYIAQPGNHHYNVLLTDYEAHGPLSSRIWQANTDSNPISVGRPDQRKVYSTLCNKVRLLRVFDMNIAIKMLDEGKLSPSCL